MTLKKWAVVIILYPVVAIAYIRDRIKGGMR